ncbi:35901_t:CDS:2, partial [Gigaspora margarita]
NDNIDAELNNKKNMFMIQKLDMDNIEESCDEVEIRKILPMNDQNLMDTDYKGQACIRNQLRKEMMEQSRDWMHQL